MALTERQRTILNSVTERYIYTGAPVSSKELVGAAGLNVSSSTVRSEFALLEERGYLRIPTPRPAGSRRILAIENSSTTS